MSVVAFAPKHPPEAGATCALVDRNGDVVTWFAVSGARDDEAPRPPLVRGGHFETQRFARCTVRHAAGGVLIAEDPEAPFGATLYATWLGVEGELPNYEDPALGMSFVDPWTVKHMVRDRSDVSPYGNLALSGRHECTPANFPYPQSRPAVLGIKALDLAGNWSEPTEVTLRPLRPATTDAYSFGSVVEPAEDESRGALFGILFLALGLGIAALVISEERS
jgi:hypothetical protein